MAAEWGKHGNGQNDRRFKQLSSDSRVEMNSAEQDRVGEQIADFRPIDESTRDLACRQECVNATGPNFVAGV